jgi:hypothetical protein
MIDCVSLNFDVLAMGYIYLKDQYAAPQSNQTAFKVGLLKIPS